MADDTVFFNHELTRRAVESALNADDRRRLNQEVLAELGGGADLSRLVHHAREADDVEAIIEFAPRAARAAMAIESHREAIAHFRTLEPYLDRIGESDRAAILDDWGRNDFYLDNIEALDILGRAIELHRTNRDDRALARTLTFVSRVNEINGRPEAADASALEAIAILESYPPSGDLAFAVSQRAWLYMMRGDGQRAIELADRAIVLAEETGDERSLIYALNTKGTEMYRFGDNDGFHLLDEARSRAKQAGYPFEESLALVNMASVAAELRELDLASELAQRAIDTAARYEIRATEDFARATYTEVLAWKGAWAVAEELAADVFGSHREIDSFYGQILGRVIGTLQTRRGRPEAATTLDRTWAAAERSGEMQYLLPAAAAQAEYMWLTGENDPDRIARFREVLDEGMRLEHTWAGGELAFWLWMLDELSGTPEGIAEPYRLVIEGKPAEAATIWEAKGVPYERALALMHADQESRLEALEIFETLGATAVAAKLKRTLKDDGVAVPRGKSRATRSHAADLTARQAEVLQLLDEGLSNIEIADRLFVSPRTVEHHVAAVLTKLDSSTREEAVTRGHAEGLLTIDDPSSRP